MLDSTLQANLTQKTFGIIGVAGYIAPRHLKAIKQNNGNLLCALDSRDCVGVLDSYFPNADFFLEFERFDRYLDKLRRLNKPLDFVSICSPNYLHDSHIRLSIRNGANAICEKPIVLNPWNLDALDSISKEYNKNIYSILQLRLHPSIVKLKEQVEKENKTYDIVLSYITSRGKWYHISWKGDESKSGGIATNIGIHFFDMLIWIFGSVQKNVLHRLDSTTASGYLELQKARVKWFLSIDSSTLPESIRQQNKQTFRQLTLGGVEFDFSDGFSDLHTLSYEKILQGEGFSLNESRSAIELAYHIRNATPTGLIGDYHSFLS